MALRKPNLGIRVKDGAVVEAFSDFPTNVYILDYDEGESLKHLPAYLPVHRDSNGDTASVVKMDVTKPGYLEFLVIEQIVIESEEAHQLNAT